MSEHVPNPISYNSLGHASINYEEQTIQKIDEAKRASLSKPKRRLSIANSLAIDESKIIEKPTRKGYEEYPQTNAASDYYLGHDSSSSNSCKGYNEGPLTTSLSASGEVDPGVQQNNTESEEALLHLHDRLPRAPVPGINTASGSSKSTSDEFGARENNDSETRFEPSRKSKIQSVSEPIKGKTESNSGDLSWQSQSAGDQWDDRPPLAPMEPIKIAKVNHSWSPNRNKARPFDAESNSARNDGLPPLPGFPAHDPGLTNPIHAQSVPSISEDARLARIIKDQEYTIPRHSKSGNQRFHTNGTNKMNELPSNMLNDTYMQPATAPPLVLVNPNSQPTIRGYNQAPQTTGSVFSFNEYTPSQIQVPFQQNSIDHNGMHENHFSKNSEGYHNAGLGNEIQDVKSGNTAYGPSVIPMRAVSNGGPLSFPSQSTHQPMNTPSYAVLLGQMPSHNALQAPAPSLTPLGASSEPAAFAEPQNSSNHQQYATSQTQMPGQHSALLIPSHVNSHLKEGTTVSKKKLPIKHGMPPSDEMGREFNIRQIQSSSHDRIYKCTHPGCDWSFARSSDQKRHIRSHQKPNLRCPYWELEPNCSRKGAMFYRLDVLKRHLRLVHLNRVTDCPMGGGICRICSHKFDSSRDFLDHCDTCALTALAQKEKLNAT